MKLDWIRGFFPHVERFIYVNHAATGPLSLPVVHALNQFIEQRHVSLIENYSEVIPILHETKARIAQLLHTIPERIEFVQNTSSGLNILAEGIRWSPGDRIAVPACEFPANVYPFMNLERRGVAIDFIPHQEGTFTLEDIQRTLRSQTRLLTLSWVQFLSGFRSDLQAIGQLCRDRNILFCVDAIQGLGALELDVEACQIDFLATGCQKWLLATQGTGFIFVSERLLERLDPSAGWLHGPVDWDNFYDYRLEFFPDARRFRLGTQNNMGIVALHAALGLYFEADPTWCEKQVLARAGELISGFERCGLEKYGSSDPIYQSGVVTIRVREPEEVFKHLKEGKINASVRNRMLRFSPTYYNSPEEMSLIVETVERYARE